MSPQKDHWESPHRVVVDVGGWEFAFKIKLDAFTGRRCLAGPLEKPALVDRAVLQVARRLAVWKARRAGLID